MGEALRFHVRPTLADPILVLAFDGWNDAGEAATSAASFLCDALETAPLAEIDPETFYDFTVRRPSVHVDASGRRRIEWPSYAFHFAEAPGGAGVIVGVGGEPHLRWRAFAAELVELVRVCGVRRCVLLGAYLADVLYSLPVGVSGHASSDERMRALGLEGSAYEGPTGIVGVLGERLRDEGLEVTSLWAGLPHYIHLSPNPRGALALVRKTGDALGIGLDLVPLREAAAEFEVRISRMVAADPALAEYVKELKRREFAVGDG